MARRCRNEQCRKLFEPTFSSLQVACSPECAHAWSRTTQGQNHVAKAKRKEHRERKAALKTKGDWLAEAQVQFNKYIRLRDYDQPCISCNTPPNDRTNFWDCGHYRSVGACPELRFEELNAHKQCKKCNRTDSGLSGNIVEYRIRLTNRIGVRKLNWLEGPHVMPRLRIEDIKFIKSKYTALCKALQAERVIV